MGALYRYGTVAMVALTIIALSACTNLEKKNATEGAAIEERGISTREMNDIDAARSQGLDERDAFNADALDADALNDPNSPLAVRVIYFDYDSSTVKAAFRPVIEAHAAYLAANPAVKLTLEGHADERGSREYNLALGERRALSVQTQLVVLGANPAQGRVVSYGEERPVELAHNEQAYGMNRRVELNYDGASPP